MVDVVCAIVEVLQVVATVKANQAPDPTPAPEIEKEQQTGFNTQDSSNYFNNHYFRTCRMIYTGFGTLDCTVSSKGQAQASQGGATICQLPLGGVGVEFCYFAPGTTNLFCCAPGDLECKQM
jgi:hypothetical protein